MTDILTGYLKVRKEFNSRFPYTNASGKYYSELIGDFTPAVGTEGGRKSSIVVRGSFDKETYKKGLKTGFEVIIFAENQTRQGMALYNADDRIRAHQTVNDIELQNALMTVDGIGETYSQRLVDAFCEDGAFFPAVNRYLNGNKDNSACAVPKRLIQLVADEEEDIMRNVNEQSVAASLFYNALNKFGFVSFKNQSRFDFQRTVKEWNEMFKRINYTLSIEKVRSVKHELFNQTTLIEEHGMHLVWLMAHPQLVLDVYGAPMSNSEAKELRNVALFYALLEVANGEFDAATIERFDLDEKGVLAYSADLYAVVKTFKDGGYDNPHGGDTVFPYTENMHRAVQRRQSENYNVSYEEAIEQFSNVDNRYPVVIFDMNGVPHIQFKATYTLNRNTVKLIRKRQTTGLSPFVEPKEYQEDLDNVLSDNGFDLHPAQYNTLLGLNNHTMSVLTGGPGTGKTTILSVFLRTLSKANQSLFRQDAHNIVFCAPTGKAAKRMKDSLSDFVDEYPVLKQVQNQTYTIHSFLLNNTDLLDRAKGAEKGSRWLIIDESSMVDEDMLHWILATVPQAYRIVFIGDEEQLPSIGAGSVLEDLLELDGIGRFNLTEPYRSTGTVMKNAYRIRDAGTNGRKIRIKDLIYDKDFSMITYEQMIQLHKQELGQDDAFYAHVMENVPDLYNRNTYSGWAASFIYKQMENHYLNPKETLFLMPFSNGKGRDQRLAVTPFNQAIQGLTYPFKQLLPNHLADLTYDELLETFNADKGTSLFDINRDMHNKHGVLNGIGANNSVIFRRGDKVISTNNQYQTLIFKPSSIGAYSSPMKVLEEVSGLWYARLQQNDMLVESKFPVMNGDMGEVKAVLKDGSVMVHFDDHDEDRWVFYQRGIGFSDHLSLSYSTTIHKAQGGEADVVVLFLPSDNDVKTMSYRELLYTAITRARKQVVILGSASVLEAALNITKGDRQTALPYLFVESANGNDFSEETSTVEVLDEDKNVLPEVFTQAEMEKVVDDYLEPVGQTSGKIIIREEDLPF